MLQKSPWIIQVYLKYRQNPHPLFQPIRDTEVLLQEKLTRELENLLPQNQPGPMIDFLESLRTGLWVRCNDPSFQESYPPEKLHAYLVQITRSVLKGTQ